VSELVCFHRSGTDPYDSDLIHEEGLVFFSHFLGFSLTFSPINFSIIHPHSLRRQHNDLLLLAFSLAHFLTQIFSLVLIDSLSHSLTHPLAHSQATLARPPAQSRGLRFRSFPRSERLCECLCLYVFVPSPPLLLTHANRLQTSPLALNPSHSVLGSQA
jgi:hypothetical protein